MASRKTSNQQRKRPECHTPDLTITLDFSVSTAVFLTVGLNRCCSLNSLHKASWLWIMPLSIKEKQQPYLRRPVIRFYGCRRIAPTSIRLNTVGLGLRTLDEGIVSSVLMSYLHKDWVAKIKFIGYKRHITLKLTSLIF